ncbi:hypothetical protein ILUMI_21077 [Ignelater luminosus]|uniref:Uncharacterized protein n=1 Tax=Ignelater luminosus TaxID=2038154 RepID=A0A8K0G404_IGNLU|nr:hypothetical protein ILUMI_21077 [Ignelater luminosus]
MNSKRFSDDKTIGNTKMLNKAKAEHKMGTLGGAINRSDNQSLTMTLQKHLKLQHQIDHVLIQEKYAKLITNVRTYRGANANADHLLIGAKLKQVALKRRKEQRRRKTRYNMGNFQRAEITRNYKQEIYNNCKGNGHEFGRHKGKKQEKQEKEKLTNEARDLEPTRNTCRRGANEFGNGNKKI